MRQLLLSALLASTFALPALAQDVVPPAGTEAAPATNAAIAHHDRKVAHRAARHHNYRKAAAANHAATAASTDAAVTSGAVPH